MCWYPDHLGREIHYSFWYTGAKEPSLWMEAPFGTWRNVEVV